MNKENWKLHIESTEDLIRPSRGGNMLDWREAIRQHVDVKCSVCRSRAKTRRLNKEARLRNALLRDICGTSAKAARIDMGLNC